VINGLNAIKTEFVSGIDTVEGVPVKKTVLLTTSNYSRVVNTPALIDLEILRNEPDERMFSKGPQPVAVLLEGNLVSSFQFRIPPELAENKELDFHAKSIKPTKMVIVSDGDIIKNQFDLSQGYPLPLGYDQYTRKTFGNKDFILNVMNYLCDESGLMTVRSRELTLRSLDVTKANKQRFFWQLFNTLLPLLLVMGFALVKFRIRKRKYARMKIQSNP
jgi:ABC-2 type transport system permease protein